MDIASLTSRKVYGIPVVYLAVAVTALALFAALKMKGQAPEEEIEPTDALAIDDGGDAGYDNQPTFIANTPDASDVVTNPIPTQQGYGGYSGPASRQGEPPCMHVVAGKSDDTYSELARLYYGLDTGDTRGIIAAANPNLLQPVGPGVSVSIPQRNLPKYYVATSAVRTVYAIARKNATTAAKVTALNPNKTFPVKVGTRVRVA